MKTTIAIRGMSCGHCVAAVAGALSGLPGVKNVQVSLERGEATFEEETPVSRESIRKAIAAAGYETD
ncbi:MAG: cation transporter [Pseudomonadota bacterium]|nr:cation transporter [Pseudomonadota bacterium]